MAVVKTITNDNDNFNKERTSVAVQHKSRTAISVITNYYLHKTGHYINNN